MYVTFENEDGRLHKMLIVSYAKFTFSSKPQLINLNFSPQMFKAMAIW